MLHRGWRFDLTPSANWFTCSIRRLAQSVRHPSPQTVCVLRTVVSVHTHRITRKFSPHSPLPTPHSLLSNPLHNSLRIALTRSTHLPRGCLIVAEFPFPSLPPPYHLSSASPQAASAVIRLLKFDPKRVSVWFDDDTCRTAAVPHKDRRQGLTLVHLSAQRKHISWVTFGAWFSPSLLDRGTRVEDQNGLGRAEKWTSVSPWPEVHLDAQRPHAPPHDDRGTKLQRHPDQQRRDLPAARRGAGRVV